VFINENVRVHILQFLNVVFFMPVYSYSRLLSEVPCILAYHNILIHIAYRPSLSVSRQNSHIRIG